MEFITEDDLRKIGEYAGQDIVESKRLELSKVYQKLEFLCQKIAEKGFRYEIRKDPRKQAGPGLFKFQEYQWARIYPPELFNVCKGKFAYIVGLNDTLHFHMMGIKDYQDMPPSRNASNLAWNEIEIKGSGYEEVADEFVAFEKKYKDLYLETGAALGIQECQKQIKSKEMKKAVELLKYKKQIILQGPPGTGKTHRALNIAYELIFSQSVSSEPSERNRQLTSLDNSNQYSLIQFHPSYTYEDFVRGIVAKPSTIGTTYEAVDKILAEFAKKAQKNWKENQEESKDKVAKEQWLDAVVEDFKEYLITKLEDDDAKIILTKKAFVYRVTETTIRFNADAWEVDGGIPISDLKKMYLADVSTRKEIKELSTLTKTAKSLSTYWMKTLELFRNYISENNLKPDSVGITTELKNYILIIDEINRANLPAVLGELIYALEYRGRTVQSMYAIEDDNSLILPPNLYIIGTMNTADRSVGHIDYAIRRRFAFVDILPDKSIISFPLAIEFFTEIEDLFKKHTASDFEINNVMLGHSYFLVDNNKDLKLRLKYEVLPILGEYLKDGVLNKSESSSQLLKIISDKIESINE
jgi:hypothetical protein